MRRIPESKIVNATITRSYLNINNDISIKVRYADDCMSETDDYQSADVIVDIYDINKKIIDAILLKRFYEP